MWILFRQHYFIMYDIFILSFPELISFLVLEMIFYMVTWQYEPELFPGLISPGCTMLSSVWSDGKNTVSTVNLDCKLDLKAIALQARNAEYNRKVKSLS